ncbi:MAG TPA: hypothetical protein VJ464_08375 [Blastocatellia bacterium]|nr:hypothetical protein [Blastocatellia bacterium]
MSDDPTKQQPGDPNKYDTSPGVTAILERITQVEERLSRQITEQIAELRAEMQKGFRAIDRQMDTLSGNMTRLQADQRDLEERVDKLERKPS